MIFLPIILLIIFPHPEQRGFLREIAVGIGFIAMSLLGLQLVPTSRFKILARTFSLEKLYDFHHKLSITTSILVLLHPILLFLDGVPLRLLNILQGSWRTRAGVIAVLAVIILIITSVWRKPVKLRYDIWRYVHNLMTYIAVGLGLYHMFLVNHFLSLVHQKVIWLTLTGIWVLIILIVKIIKPLIISLKPYEVTSIKQERGSCWSLDFKPVGHEGFKFSAGQFAWISRKSPFLYYENPFSFSTDSDVNDGSFGFTIKELGDFTNTIKGFKPGDKVYIDGPYGTFSMDNFKCKEVVFIAGGIGSAPVMSMLRTMSSRGDKTPLIFFYGSPSWDEIIYREELEELSLKLDLKLIHVLEKPYEGWRGETGYISLNLLKEYLPGDYQEWIYFMCGPLPMLNAMEKYLAELQVPHKNIHSEKYDMA
jgi:3-phenylpropionate/trans-cinnamate dioxygenase ferredoxin reductase subunit